MLGGVNQAINNGSGILEFIYDHDFDENGVFFFLGS
jgi:hypothetical protein